MNNKLRQGLIISTIVTLGLLGQVKEAIASALNKTTHNTEKLAKITHNTVNALSIGLNDNANIIPPDSTQIKAFFMEWDILTNDEKKDFIELRNNATQSGIRNFYEQQIVKFFDPIFDNEEKKMFIVLLLDPNQNTQIWQTEFEKIKNDEMYQNIFLQSIDSMQSEINLAQSEARLKQSIKEGEQLKAEGEQLKAEGEQLKAEIIELKAEGEKLKQDEEELRGLKRTLMDMEEVFKNYLKIEGEKLEQDKEKLDEKIESLNKVEKTFENQKKEETKKF